MVTMFSLDRNDQHVSRLKLSLFLLPPVFLGMRVVMPWLEGALKEGPHGRLAAGAAWLSRGISQNLAQYILAFCLPFFMATQRWIYLGFTFLLFLSTLWDPWWARLTRQPLYMLLLQLWALLCALSYLYPFFWPDGLDHFHHAMLLMALIAVIPANLSRTHLGASTLLFLFALTLMVVLPREGRFPVLSVWPSHPHFAFDAFDPMKIAGENMQPEDLTADQLASFLARGHTLCCVAPVTAPPAVREKVTQGWSLDGFLVERQQLDTAISGNPEGQPFRSYYCKRHFPQFKAGMVIGCELYLADDLYMGQIKIHIK